MLNNCMSSFLESKEFLKLISNIWILESVEFEKYFFKNIKTFLTKLSNNTSWDINIREEFF